MIPVTQSGTIANVLSTASWKEGVAHKLASSAHVIVYEKGSTIFHAGEAADLLYVLLAGEAKVYYTRPGGDRLLVDIVPPRHLLGFLHPTDRATGEPEQPFSAEALSRCTVALITRGRVVAAVQELSAEEMARISGHLAEQWARLSERGFNYLMLDVRGRLELAIANLCERFGIWEGRSALLPLRLSHEDFGELIGASRPMVSRHLKDLADAGVFYKRGGRYILTQPLPLSPEASPQVSVAVPARREPSSSGRDVRALRTLRAIPKRPLAIRGLRKVAH